MPVHIITVYAVWSAGANSLVFWTHAEGHHKAGYASKGKFRVWWSWCPGRRKCGHCKLQMCWTIKFLSDDEYMPRWNRDWDAGRRMTTILFFTGLNCHALSTLTLPPWMRSRTLAVGLRTSLWMNLKWKRLRRIREHNATTTVYWVDCIGFSAPTDLFHTNQLVSRYGSFPDDPTAAHCWREDFVLSCKLELLAAGILAEVDALKMEAAKSKGISDVVLQSVWVARWFSSCWVWRLRVCDLNNILLILSGVTHIAACTILRCFFLISVWVLIQR